MRHSRAYLAAALFALLLVVAAERYVSASARAAQPCAPRRSHVLVGNGEAQVYQQGEAAVRGGALGGPQTIFGCIRGRSGAYPLGSAPFGSRTMPVRVVARETLAGPIVAYERRATSMGGPESSVIMVRDLRTGRLLHSAPAETPGTPPPDLSPMRIAEIVLKRDGALAWIVTTGNSTSPYFQLHAIDQSGSRVLVAANTITPDSLSLSDENLLTWAQSGEVRAAELN